jgi:hypothetical protein
MRRVRGEAEVHLALLSARVMDREVEERGRKRAARTVVVVHSHFDLGAPGARIGSRERQPVVGDRRCGRACAGDAYDQCVAAPVLEVVVDGEGHGAVGPQSAEDAIVLGEAVDANRAEVLRIAIERPAQRAPDERRDRSGYASDGTNPTE